MLVAVVMRLKHNHEAGKLSSPRHNAHHKYAFFFFLGHRNSTYYWEGVMMIRMMGIVAFSSLNSPMLQLVFGIVIITIAFVMNIQLAPVCIVIR
jgi:hypothetical protein